MIYDSTHDHSAVIIDSEQTIEKRSDGFEPGCSVWNKKDKNDNCSDASQNVSLIAISSGKEFRYRNCAQFGRITAQTLRYDKPVQIRSDGQTDDSPADLCHAGNICEPRKAHQQPAAHIRSFRTHSGDNWSSFLPPR